MKNLSSAVEIALSVRSYLRENVDIHPVNSKDIQETHERISRELKNLTKPPSA